MQRYLYPFYGESRVCDTTASGEPESFITQGKERGRTLCRIVSRFLFSVRKSVRKTEL